MAAKNKRKFREDMELLRRFIKDSNGGALELADAMLAEMMPCVLCDGISAQILSISDASQTWDTQLCDACLIKLIGTFDD